MEVANFSFRQDVNFTYQKGDNSSYIDHVLVPSYLMDRLSQCEILCRDSDNVSDHLAIKTSLQLNVPQSNTESNNYKPLDTILRGNGTTQNLGTSIELK